MIKREETFVCADAPGRLDKYLVVCLPELSRTRVQNLIKAGKVLVNGVPARKTGQALAAEDVVQVTITEAEPSDLVPEKIPLDVIFENDEVLLVNKPAGMVVHPSPGHTSGTLVNAVLAHAPDILGVGGVLRPGVVHRLDKDTSGVIVLAKNDLAHQFLQEQFRARTVHKTYLALVDGAPPTPEGIVETAIGRDNHNRKRMAVVPPHKGRESVTEYHVLETFDAHTLVSAHPKTGRTHQIRLHLAFLGCPIVGDALYGRKKPSVRIKRQFLHAARLSITLPGEREPRAFEAPLPGHLRHVLDLLRRATR